MRQLERDAEFTTFTHEHRTQLLRLGRLLTAGDEAAAEDLVQATLTKAYLAWPSVRGADDPLRYVQRVLSNAFIDESRRAYRRREVLRDDAVIGEATVPGHDHELRSVVMSALRDLPPGQRAVVILRHWLDLDVATTAAALGLSPGTVKSQNAKALQHLRDNLAPLDIDLTTHAEPVLVPDVFETKEKP